MRRHSPGAETFLLARDLGDEHPVVRRSCVRENVRAGGVADGALEDGELPERVRLGRLGELCEREDSRRSEARISCSRAS
jgi:hypothetical protein